MPGADGLQMLAFGRELLNAVVAPVGYVHRIVRAHAYAPTGDRTARRRIPVRPQPPSGIPSAFSFWTRPLRWSAMYMLSAEVYGDAGRSVELPVAPFPARPNWVTNLPSASYTQTRLLCSSVMYSRPALSNAIATGQTNCPSPSPYPLPNS